MNKKARSNNILWQTAPQQKAGRAVLLLSVFLGLSCAVGGNQTRFGSNNNRGDSILLLEDLALGSALLDSQVAIQFFFPLAAVEALRANTWDGASTSAAIIDPADPCAQQTFSRIGTYGIGYQQSLVNCTTSLDSGTVYSNGKATSYWLANDSRFAATVTIASLINEFADGATNYLSGRAIWQSQFVTATPSSTGAYEFSLTMSDTSVGVAELGGRLTVTYLAAERFAVSGDWTYRLNTQTAKVKLASLVFQYGMVAPDGCPQIDEDGLAYTAYPPVMPIDGEARITLPTATIDLHFLACSVKEYVDGDLNQVFDGTRYDDQRIYAARYGALVPGYLFLRFLYVGEVNLALLQKRWCTGTACLEFSYSGLADPGAAALLVVGAYTSSQVTSSPLAFWQNPGFYSTSFDTLALAITDTSGIVTSHTFAADLAVTSLTLTPLDNFADTITLTAAPFVAPQTNAPAPALAPPVNLDAAAPLAALPKTFFRSPWHQFAHPKH